MKLDREKPEPEKIDFRPRCKECGSLMIHDNLCLRRGPGDTVPIAEFVRCSSCGEASGEIKALRGHTVNAEVWRWCCKIQVWTIAKTAAGSFQPWVCDRFRQSDMGKVQLLAWGKLAPLPDVQPELEIVEAPAPAAPVEAAPSEVTEPESYIEEVPF